MDYYGESHGWPNVISEFGQFDVVGFPKAIAYWYASQWLAAVPETSFDRAPVGPANQCHLELWKSAHKANVYTNGDSAELFNTTGSMGNITIPQGLGALQDGSWSVPSEALVNRGDRLSVVCYQGGKPIGSDEIVASGPAAGIMLTLDAPSISTGTGAALLADGQDVALLRAMIVDDTGHAVTNASNNVSFKVVSGPGRVIASHNGHTANHEPNHAPWHSAWKGLVRGIVQVTTHQSGPQWYRARMLEVDVDGGRRTAVLVGQAPPTIDNIVVEASSNGLASGRVTIAVSTDVAKNSVLAAATTGVTAPLVVKNDDNAATLGTRVGRLRKGDMGYHIMYKRT